MEDYEKKYKEALGRANAKIETYNHLGNASVVKSICEIFPELRESEDERIKTNIIKLLRFVRDTHHQYSDECNESINWLEKQDEQKPANNIEPKFKVGDFIKHNTANIIRKVVSINNNGSYDVENIKSNIRIKLFTPEQNFHLWSIKDAKDGDVLVSKHGNPFIFNGVVRKTTIGAYCGINIRGSFIITPLYNDNYDWTSLSISPATEEQRDLLFSKMKEAGYEWDAEKKVLTKLENEHVPITEWIEDYWKHHKVTNPDSYNGGEEIQFDHDGFIRFCQAHCQKSAWSEEDEKNLQSIIDEIEADKRSAPGYDLATYDRFLYWLQSLKERCAFKPTNEQIIALRWTLNNIPYCNHKEEISGLLDQIKNL